MYNKLISLILMLAFAGIAQAATVMWNETVQSGNWEDVSNWVTTVGIPKGALPGTGDFAGIYPRNNGTPGTSYNAVTINLSTYQEVGRVKPQLNTVTLNINNGGTLLNNGSVGSMQMYGGTAETININSGGALIARGSATGLQTGSGNHTININSGGMMGAYGTTSHLATNALWLGGTSSGAGTTTINVYGVLDVDSVTLANTNHQINLHLGGRIYVWGTLNGAITAWDGSLLRQTVIDPVVGSPLYGQTVTMYVPEPATLLLLGFGAVMLRKKR